MLRKANKETIEGRKPIESTSNVTMDGNIANKSKTPLTRETSKEINDLIVSPKDAKKLISQSNN